MSRSPLPTLRPVPHSKTEGNWGVTVSVSSGSADLKTQAKKNLVVVGLQGGVHFVVG